ncbi:Ubiquitin carboxyl-terminal hydrolase, partial [Brachionus plicatilis]
MGIGGSSIEGADSGGTPFNEHFFGLVNFGNTCYANSVLQALYFCRPFRERIIQYKLAHAQRIAHFKDSKEPNQTNESGESCSPTASILRQEHLLNCLAELFYTIVTMKKKKGIVHPKKFISRLRKDNEAFDNLFQQDAHEFLNYLLNTCADILKAEMQELNTLNKKSVHQKINTQNHKILSAKSANGKTNRTTNQANSQTINQTINQTTTPVKNGSISSQTSVNLVNDGIESETSSWSGDSTWIHDLFQGILVNETRCLNCETSSSKEENFFDLSIDVEQNTSLSHCLQEFSNMEMLCGECKYYCDTCSSKQEAEKRMRIKKLPKILALHLKRFKFVSNLNRFKKLTYRVVFPFELRLFNTTDDCADGDQIYDLVSFVVHCGIGLN